MNGKCEGEKTDSGFESDKVRLLLYHTFLFLNPNIIFNAVKKQKERKKSVAGNCSVALTDN